VGGSFIEAFWRRNQSSGEHGGGIDYHALAVATVGGLFEAVTDWPHEADPPRPRTFDDLVSDLTTNLTYGILTYRASTTACAASAPELLSESRCGSEL
jgi:hypothetical protein